MKKLSPLIGLALFVAALWILHDVLRHYHYHDIARNLHAIPLRQVLLALLLTACSYSVLTGYDTLAIRYIHHPLKYSKIALTSFIGYAFSQSLGFPLFTGSSVRYRLYSSWGLSTAEIGQAIAFAGFTFWLGIFTIGGFALLLEPAAISGIFHMHPATLRPAGILLIGIVVLYLLWTTWIRKPLTIRGWTLQPPLISVSIIQIVLSSVDWAIAAAILYVLLPGGVHLSFLGYLGIFVLSQSLGVLSHMPGGLGVFDTAILLLLEDRVPAPQLLGALVAYRAIYYMLPLCAALLLFGANEMQIRREQVRRVAQFLGGWVPQLAPTVLATTTFIGGALLLFSGATPAVPERLLWLDRFFPLPVLELSHFAGSLIGMGLLLLSRGLQRRLDAAYQLTTFLLAMGMITSLLKGFDYEEAILLAIMLALLIPSRPYFYRSASLISQRFSFPWVVAIVLVLTASIWLGIFMHKHVEYSSELWWQFELSKEASRSMRATVAAAVSAFCIALVQLMRPSPPEPGLPGPEEITRAKAVIQEAEDTEANLALLGDKDLLFSKSGRSFLMYGVAGRSWVALGDPVGLEEEKPELAWAFRELSDRHDGWTVFYEVGVKSLPLYLDMGLTLSKLGEEGRVPLQDFNLEGGEQKPFRHLVNKMEKTGVSFSVISPREVEALIPEMKKISDTWLAEKSTREKRFSLGYFNPEYLIHFPSAVVRDPQGRLLAFANLWQGGRKEELSLDLMRYSPEAPKSVMDYLFLRLMMWGAQQHFHWFNLGMAPLSGLSDRSLTPFWNKLGVLLFRYGEHFYNFQGLRKYKEKFHPVWEPKYLASPGGLVLPRILTNIASLISGGLGGVVTR